MWGRGRKRRTMWGRGRKPGTVAAVGSGKVQPNGEKKALGIKAGENVMYARYAGCETSLEGKRFMIVQEKDLNEQDRNLL